MADADADAEEYVRGGGPAELAVAGRGSRLAVGELSRRRRIPARFLERILRELARSGIVDGRRGTRGGYALSRPPEEVSVLDVVALEGEVRPRLGRCTGGGLSATTRVWEEAAAAYEEALSGCSIALVVCERYPVPAGRDPGVIPVGLSGRSRRGGMVPGAANGGV